MRIQIPSAPLAAELRMLKIVCPSISRVTGERVNEQAPTRGRRALAGAVDGPNQRRRGADERRKRDDCRQFFPSARRGSEQRQPAAMMTSLEPAGDRDMNLNHVKAADVFASHAVASERRVSEDGPAIMEEINQGHDASWRLRRTLLVPIPLEPGGEQQAPPAAGAAAVLSASTSLDSLHSSSSCSTRTNGVPRSGSQTELDRSEQSAADFLSGIDSVIASSRTNVQKLGTNQPLSELDEDVLFVRPAHSRLRRDLYPDPAAVPATAVRGRRSDARRRTEQRHNDIFEL
ncbi:hypothetical protein FJT64_019181 [Amphibalanus amphitrite]|uniref:Uncharacterized protein n=1 Tax=Amphibalanus amphitrite TaxID=1232801 RepID=A0A6A4X102_AMPAM|nr:hypothetical protein FJT64_019181 [Amphibalanus amphitrite]